MTETVPTCEGDGLERDSRDGRSMKPYRDGPPLLSRRVFVAGGVAAGASSLLGACGGNQNTKAVVIGAGAAGLSATRTLMEAGIDTVCIEASGRIGGRVHTDTAQFGVPYDIGAHWLHQGALNPFVDYGREHGFDVYPASNDEVLYVGDRLASGAETQAFEDAYARAYDAISLAGRRREDIPASDVVDATGDWADTVHMHIGPYSMGKNYDRFSCLDWYNSADGADWFCRQGYGALVAHWARDVPVVLSTVAKAVNWNGKGVAVETNTGSISADLCVVTVSTGVLASGAIRFDPPLPLDKQEAVARISMGTYNHIALQFRQNFFGIGDDGYVNYRLDGTPGGSPRGIGLMVNIGGTGLTLADVGGAFAVELEGLGPTAAIDFAMSELRAIFGSTVDDALIKAHVTAWGRNPLTRGSFASADPGAYPQRQILRRSVGGRIHFAGEATSKTQWATVAGAYKEGRRVAREVAREVARNA